MLENKFKQGLTKELKERFPGCVVVHLDPNEVQGHPDLLVLYGSTWAALEGKRSANSPSEPADERGRASALGRTAGPGKRNLRERSDPQGHPLWR